MRQVQTTRRNFLIAAASGVTATACRMPPDRPGSGKVLTPEREWRTALGTSLRDEHDYEADVEGDLPAGLNGRLYRNGPGLFERGGYRKQHLLDGDGMLQCFEFSAGTVRYRNRFVRTEKFIAEAAAGVFSYPTWTTLAPAGLFTNLGNRIKSQAGVTTLVRDGNVLALDEVIPLHVLDPDSLDTLGAFNFPEGVEMPGCKAHTKTDPVSGDWVLAATEYGRTMTLRWLVLARDGSVKAQGTVKSPRMSYLHDFMVTGRHIVFVLHPAEFSPFGMLLGLRSFTDSLTWKPDQGNLVMVLDRSGGEPVFAPRGSNEDDGWILTQVHSDKAENNFLAVFDAGNLAAGPVAQVRLRHHVPLSFHGFWDGRQ